MTSLLDILKETDLRVSFNITSNFPGKEGKCFFKRGARHDVQYGSHHRTIAARLGLSQVQGFPAGKQALVKKELIKQSPEETGLALET